MPFLQKITVFPPPADSKYPFNIPIFEDGLTLSLTTNVTFFVGEKGSGKSTLLEGIADNCGFNVASGSKNHRFGIDPDNETLSSSMHFLWKPMVSNGFFMRAESFFNFASFIDELASEDIRSLDPYGGKSLHQQSHGESFFSLFNNQFSKGLYILDEPEAALSPNRQFAFMMLIRELEKSGQAQFIIATHSPILLSYPGATIFSVEKGMPEIKAEDTEHFQFTKDFLNNPGNYLRHLE